MRASHARHDESSVHYEGTASRVVPTRRITPVALAPIRKQMHPGVYKLALLCWVMLLGVFWITFAMSANAMFMVAIATGYAIVFFGVPFLMSRIAGISTTASISLRNFVDGRFDTINGPIGGLEALLQVILVPLSLSIGGIAIGFIIHAAKMAN